MIQDVVQGHASYKAILVYDVSRWGRSQDTDESAHYEFLCKSAGVRVHYCAETFSNDDALASMIMKSLKRVMAGEYSRELGIKVLAGQIKGAELGFRQGGQPGYWLTGGAQFHPPFPFSRQTGEGDSYRRRENSYTPHPHRTGVGSGWGPLARAQGRARALVPLGSREGACVRGSVNASGRGF